ncbi:MAG: serine hydrolase, partial [Bacteroidota bacterium]
LRQTSDWEGTLWGKPDWADRPRGEADSWTTRARNAPGTVYKYNDTRVNLLALCIMNIWRKPLPQVLEEHFMSKIGASKTWRWHGYENSWIVLDGAPVQAVSGGGHWGGGMFINAYDQARLGYLTLRKGKWGSEQVLSEEWIQMARTPGPANKGYGFMNYFLNTDRERYPSAPSTAYAHIGAGTNMVYVDEENDLVIVARWIDRPSIDEFLGKVLNALE